MTFDPTSILTDAEKHAIVADRAKTWATAAYSHQLNREAIEELPDGEDKSEQLRIVNKQIADLSKSVQDAVIKRDALSAVIESKAEQEVK